MRSSAGPSSPRPSSANYTYIYFAVVDADDKAAQAERREGLIDDAGDLRLVADIQLAVADHVDVRLVKLAEAAALGALAAVDLADLEAAEGEAQFAGVQRDVFGQRHGQVKAHGQIVLPFLEAVDLLFRLAAAFGQQDLRRLEHGRVERGEAVQRVDAAQRIEHALKLKLRAGQQFHKTRERARFDAFHTVSP